MRTVVTRSEPRLAIYSIAWKNSEGLWYCWRIGYAQFGQRRWWGTGGLLLLLLLHALVEVAAVVVVVVGAQTGGPWSRDLAGYLCTGHRREDRTSMQWMDERGVLMHPRRLIIAPVASQPATSQLP